MTESQDLLPYEEISFLCCMCYLSWCLFLTGSRYLCYDISWCTFLVSILFQALRWIYLLWIVVDAFHQLWQILVKLSLQIHFLNSYILLSFCLSNYSHHFVFSHSICLRSSVLYFILSLYNCSKQWLYCISLYFIFLFLSLYLYSILSLTFYFQYIDKLIKLILSF